MEWSCTKWRFGRIWKKNTTQMMIFLPIENVCRKITNRLKIYMYQKNQGTPLSVLVLEKVLRNDYGLASKKGFTYETVI